jgi:hypothetical protein
VADLLVERGYGACEVDSEGGLWMDWTFAEEFSALAAEPVVIHPAVLLGRQRGYAIRAVVEQLRGLRERVDPKGRTVLFGLEVGDGADAELERPAKDHRRVDREPSNHAIRALGSSDRSREVCDSPWNWDVPTMSRSGV